MKNTVFPIYFNETALHLAVENENLDIIQNIWLSFKFVSTFHLPYKYVCIQELVNEWASFMRSQAKIFLMVKYMIVNGQYSNKPHSIKEFIKI